MKRWLITTSTASDLDEVRRAVADLGGTVDDAPPISLGPDEQVVEAEGPDDLQSRLHDHPAVLKVSPDSPKHPFG